MLPKRGLFSCSLYFSFELLPMASKKATCYILNVAHSMSNDFPKALSTLTENIEDKVHERNHLPIHAH